MSIDEMQTSKTGATRRFRADEGRFVFRLPPAQTWCKPAVLAIGLAFVLIGGVSSDLTGADARLALAATEGFGPMGQVYGHWRPDVWPLPTAISMILTRLGKAGSNDPGAVLWPLAIAGLAAGWIVARRFIAHGSTTMALLFGFAWFGSWALMTHAGSTGIDFLSGLASIAALDRLIGRKSDWIAGLWASLAFLSGGWPPLVVIGLSVIVLGRRDADFSFKMIAPPVVTMVAWFFWTLEAASAEAVAAALAWPLTRRLPWALPDSFRTFAAALAVPLDQRPAWAVPIGVAVMGLPLSPFAGLALGGSMRRDLKARDGGIVLDWVRVGLAAVIGGTVIPGLASSSALVALAGLLVAAAAGLEAAWSGRLSTGATRAFFGLVLATSAAWLVIAGYGSFLLTIVFTYYRPIGVVLAIGSIGVAVLVWRSVETWNAKRAVAALLLLTACLKLGHAGFYSPEWTYRYGQGPWGRAIGQWLLPHWTIYTQHEWPQDLAWAIGRPIRILPSPQHLAFPETDESRHVLLLESEFANWPASAPKLVQVASFLPPHPFAPKRILARTEGILKTPSGRLVSRVPAPQ